jgi:hypothetical protein
MKLTLRGKIVFALLGLMILCTLIAVALTVPESAGVILVLMILMFFGIIISYAKDSYRHADDFIKNASEVIPSKVH